MATRTALLPVIDLMAGQVVRGVGGQREAYRPIVSALCHSSDPVLVGRRLCEHCASPGLYVADLDALMGGQVQIAVLHRLLQALPGLRELWLDAGFADADAATEVLTALQDGASRVVPVFASESLRSRAALADCFRRHPQAVLSLDRRNNTRLDPAGCWDAPELWPARVIVMTLERVGTGRGPDLRTLAEVRARAPAARLVGAGGLRSMADLAAAGTAGAESWLVASALHDLQLPPAADRASA